MNTPNDKLEHELSRALGDQADRFSHGHSSDVSMETVMQRAGEIRRGRRMRATLVMAAVVLAVAVPVGVTVLGDDNPAARRDQPAAPVNTEPLTLTGLKAGDRPEGAYIHAGTLYDGATELPLGKGGTPTELAKIDGGYLVARSDDSGNRVVSFLASDRSDNTNSWPMGDGGFAVSPDGNVGTFVEPDGTVIAVQDAGSRWYEVADLPGGDGYGADAIQGENCSGRSEETGCSIWVHSFGQTPRIYEVSPNRQPRPVLDGWLSLSDVFRGDEGDLFAGMISASDEGSCSEVALAKADDTTTAFRTCNNSFDRFSPDGNYLLGGPAYRDGMGDGSLAILDARTGASKLELGTTHEAILVSRAWEDATHLLVVVYQGNQWAVVRVAVDGSRELALPAISDNGDYSSPYLLATR